MTPVLGSIHNERGLPFVVAGRPERMTLVLRNAADRSFDLTAPEPEIRVDFRAAGDLTLESAECRGFRVESLEGGVLELRGDQSHGWWFPDEPLRVELSGLSLGGEPGAFEVAVTLDGLAERELHVDVPLVKLADDGEVEASWVGGSTLTVAPSNVAAPRNDLTLRVEPGDKRVHVLAGALVSSGRAGDARLRAAPDTRCTIERLPGPQPVWAVTPTEPQPHLDLTLSRVVAADTDDPAQVLVCTDDGFAVLAAELVGASVAIKRFEVDPKELLDIDKPTPVYVSWEVENASAVTLSGVGVVDERQERLELLVEASTTFVLTAYDSAFHTIVAKQARVEVRPDLASRMVPAGTIMAWSGLLTDIPAGWVLCDGQYKTPDLRDRFVVGAGLSEKPHNMGEADTHTHVVGPLARDVNTEGAGAHTHGMPSRWYARAFTGGDYTGIDTNGNYNPNEQTQSSGWHTHVVKLSFPAFQSTPNTGNVRPKWYALAYIMKTGWAQ